MNRREVFAGMAGIGAATILPRAGFAEAPMLGAGGRAFRRFILGDFEVTALADSTRHMADPQNFFATNIDTEEFIKFSEENLIPSDQVELPFHPSIVNTGSQLILFDTGTSPSTIKAALQAAGYSPDQVDLVVITHMHGDHIGGMEEGGEAVFANAEYVTGANEFDSWAASGDEGFETKVRPFAEKFRMIAPDESVVSGITAIDAFGHTPGHMIYHLESAGKRLAITADTANHFAWSVEQPDWHFSFDMDKEAAVASRRKVFGMLAADKVPFLGYHMPFPALGYVEGNGDRFEYVPVSYQLEL